MKKLWFTLVMTVAMAAGCRPPQKPAGSASQALGGATCASVCGHIVDCGFQMDGKTCETKCAGQKRDQSALDQQQAATCDELAKTPALAGVARTGPGAPPTPAGTAR